MITKYTFFLSSVHRTYIKMFHVLGYKNVLITIKGLKSYWFANNKIKLEINNKILSGMEEVKLSLFPDNIMLHLENLKDPTKISVRTNKWIQ